MDAKLRKKITVQLILNESEARWLRAYMQNPKGIMNTDELGSLINEDDQDTLTRRDLFDALQACLEDK